MATLKLHQPINMTTLQAWDGEFPIADSTHIRATDGVRTQDYFGTFQYSNDDLSGGTLTSTVAYQNGLYYEVTDLNIDALTMAGYINDFDFKGALNEVLKGNDTLIGSDGNDVLTGGAGNDHFDGGAGQDTVAYSNGRANVTATAADGGYVLQMPGKTDTLVNIERASFGDGSTLALDVGQGQNAGSAYRLYQAAFDRKPDAGGLKYWINDLDNGATLQQVAKGFVDSAEFKQLTPATDNKSIINSFYQHVLHRDADEGGFKYWEDSMAQGMTASEMLVSFSESAENMNNAAADLNGGLWLV
ncbi:TPA: DUF4214 domain-containing protein [Pseudomonas aeruginosa]|nr:DUF4214 domain-containing protein [Pseudomonas aeruginosa]HCF5338676.1 DUF4214 domain-containing protein [Pseudomonas aeruginosa]